jgi:hypothetical protein
MPSPVCGAGGIASIGDSSQPTAASRQDAKNTNTALPGFPPDSKAYETDTDSSARRN